MSRNRLLMGFALVVVGSTVVTVAPAAAARSCFGRTATIVGTNRDPRKPVEIKGTSGDDVIVGLDGWDIITGRGGDDLICTGGGDDYIKAGPGRDKVRGHGGFDTILGGGGADRMWGGGNTDALLGGAGADRMFGEAGPQDSLIGGPGDDHMDGGRGYDLAEFWDSPRAVMADLRAGTATGHGRDEIVSFEGLVGSNHDDTLLGDEYSNMIQGGGGDDSIEAFGSTADGGFDLLRSGGGVDTLDGGAGMDMASYNLQPYPVAADLVTGEAISAEGFGHDSLIGIEHLVGSKYDDTLMGDDNDNAIIGNGGNDVMDGRGGVDEAAFFDSREPVVADLGAGTATAGDWGSDTFANFENLQGSGFRDVLSGDDGPNVIWGGARSDSLHGLGGDDELIGQSGTDAADGGEGTDSCDAETETNCEVDPSVAHALMGPSILRWSAKSGWSVL
jgi:Ca2+-binding RTX toxin-like protein